MPAITLLRSVRSALESVRWRRKQRPASPRLWLERLEDRTVPTVTAVPQTFPVTVNAPTNLNVLAADSSASTEPVSLVSVGAVTPSGPTLTRNDDGSLTFTSARNGTYTFNHTVTGAQQELTASDGAANDQFGFSVAIDGTTAVVGAYLHQVGSHTNQGAAYVYTLSDHSWSLQQELTASDGAANDFFGLSVAVSGDTVVVGAHSVS